MTTPAVTPALPKIGLLAAIDNWTLIGLAAVSVAEQTKTSESTGASKFKVALDIIQNEASLSTQVDPELAALEAPILKVIIDGAVLVNNLKGLFTHATKTAATAAPTTPATPALPAAS